MKIFNLIYCSSITFGLLMISHFVSAQEKKPTPLLREKITKVLNLPKDEYHLISDEMFDKKLDSVLNTASGFSYKDGKAAKTAATIDDKSFTFNLNVSDKRKYTLQLSVAGTGKESFVDLFKKTKYQNALSFGAIFSWFPSWNYATYRKSTKDKLSLDLARIDSYFTNQTKTTGKAKF